MGSPESKKSGSVSSLGIDGEGEDPHSGSAGADRDDLDDATMNHIAVSEVTRSTRADSRGSRDDEPEELAADQLGRDYTAQMLAEVPMFARLDPEQLRVLAGRVELEHLEEGEVLFEYGDPGDYMMILLKGRVELSVKTKTGDKVFLELVEPREFFGEISLLDEGPRTASARVVEAGEAIVVDRGDLDELLQLQPTSALSLLVAAGKRMRASAAILRNTASRNVNEQIQAEQSGVVLRVADWVANFSGSIDFLLLHMTWFAIWILLNAGILPFGNFDPFPFGLLTMIVSLEAIMLSTLILFSSNRQAARDRLRGEIEYDVNLKAELQIQQLHEKMDTLHAEILRRLETIDAKRRGAPPGK